MMDKKIYIEKLDYETLAMLPLCLSVSDLDSKYLWACQEVVNHVGFKSLDELIGVTDYDIKVPAAEFASTFIAQNQSVINSQKDHRYLTCCHYTNGELLLFDNIKSPVYNQNEDIVGIMILAKVMKDIQIKQFGHCILNAPLSEKANNKGQYCFEFHETFQGEVPLTARQAELLFLLMRGKTVADAASILDLSKRTLEGYVNHLKDKFLCHSKSQLVEKAIHLGYWTVIPERFLGQPEVLL